MRSLFAFLDPRLGRPALVVEADYRTTVERHARHDESDAREQLARMVFDLRTTRRALLHLPAS
jgi:hypothetical protein